MTRQTIDLDREACAFIEIAVRRSLGSAEGDLEIARRVESPRRQAEEDSETFFAGRRVATAKALVEVLTKAVCISVTFEIPAEAAPFRRDPCELCGDRSCKGGDECPVIKREQPGPVIFEFPKGENDGQG